MEGACMWSTFYISQLQEIPVTPSDRILNGEQEHFNLINFKSDLVFHSLFKGKATICQYHVLSGVR